MVTGVAPVVYAFSVGFQLTLLYELQSGVLQIFVNVVPLKMVPLDWEADAPDAPLKTTSMAINMAVMRSALFIH
jgi:hypothetical protein